MREKFIDYNTPTETFNFVEKFLLDNSKLDKTKVKNGKTYSLLGLSTKEYFCIQRVLAGLWVAAETILTLGSRFSSDKTQSNWKIFFTGKTTIVVYKENPPSERNYSTAIPAGIFSREENSNVFVISSGNSANLISKEELLIPPPETILSGDNPAGIADYSIPPTATKAPSTNISPIKENTKTLDATNSIKASNVPPVTKTDPKRNSIKFTIAGNTQEVKKITNILKNKNPKNHTIKITVQD